MPTVEGADNDSDDVGAATAAATAGRSATEERATGETRISASVSLDGDGAASVSTGLSFLDHLLVSLAKHSMIDMTVKAESLDGIKHHLVEDTAITVGAAIDKALGDRAGIARFGHASVPLDESLAESTIDLVRRPYVRVSLALKPSGQNPAIEDMPQEDVEHFFQSLLENMAACVHLDVRYGQNDHHKTEAAVKSLAVSLRAALAIDTKRAGGAPSTKGSM